MVLLDGAAKVTTSFATYYTDEIWTRNCDNLKFWIKDQN